ncbi:MAG TPA: tetratricopeptide repeat protein, partial [Dongiaceae bacterium]|nr:tetratricopeptide repeat protein [Dongiaceae bacterium]
MADIFREVDEELSRDRAMAAWRKYGRYVIVFAGVAVLAVAAFSGWQDYRERQRQAEGRAYYQAIDLVIKDDSRAATAAMAQIAANGGGYRLLALLEEASLKVKAGDRAGAVKIYDDMAADSGASRPFRDLATILSVMVSLDKGDPAALKQRLQPLAAPDQPFHPSAV